MKKIKHSFGSYKCKNGSIDIKVVKVAEELAHGWGDIPKKINDLRAMELHVLAVSFLKLKKKKRSGKRMESV